MQNPGARGNTESLTATFWASAIHLESRGTEHQLNSGPALLRGGRAGSPVRFALVTFEALKACHFLGDRHPYTGHFRVRKQPFFPLSFLRSFLHR